MKKFQRSFDFFSLLKKEDLNSIHLFYDAEAYFKDPFNEIHGATQIKKIFFDMFENLKSPKFTILEIIENDNQAFLTWDFTFILNSKEFTIHGSSHLKFNEQKLINYHRDYWDVGEELLLKLPVIKYFYRFMSKSFSSTRTKVNQ
jgi:steroid delta-isomerase